MHGMARHGPGHRYRFRRLPAVRQGVACPGDPAV